MNKQETYQIIERFSKLVDKYENKPKWHTLCKDVVFCAESLAQQINLGKDKFEIKEYVEDVNNAIENCYQQEII